MNKYLPYIATGMTIQEVADKFRISHGAVHDSLARENLPTCARDYLKLMTKKMLAPSVERVCYGGKA